MDNQFIQTLKKNETLTLISGDDEDLYRDLEVGNIHALIKVQQIDSSSTFNIPL